MPKVNKLISSRKCKRCRHDRQKCLPESRIWPGQRCDRCQKYSYTCSANCTRAEENSPSAEIDPGPVEINSTPTGFAQPISDKEIALYLQETQDLQHFAEALEDEEGVFPGDSNADTELGPRIRHIHSVLEQRIEQFLEDGNYRDAEYLLSHMSLRSRIYPHPKIMSKLVIIHEKAGNLSAAELYLERILVRFNADSIWDKRFSEGLQKLSRLYTLFYLRMQNFDFLEPTRKVDFARRVVFSRTVRLGIRPLIDMIMTNDVIGLPSPPVHFAAQIGASNMIKILVRDCNFDIDSKNSLGYTAVHCAVKNAQAEMLEILLQLGADKEIKANWNESALHLTIKYNSLECTQTLLENGAMIDARGEEGKTALHYAAIYCKRASLQSLLDYGAAIDIRSRNGKTALHYTTISGDKGILQSLLKGGANVDLQCVSGRTALHYATISGDKGILQSLLEGGANVNLQCRGGKTALHYATISGDKKILQSLLEGGANVDLQCGRGKTALHYAAVFGDKEILQSLLKGSAIVDLQCEEGKTPLHYAATRGNASVVNELLNPGATHPIQRCIAKVNATDNKQRTALYHAAANGHLDAVGILLQNGADIEARGDDGLTALLVAVTTGQIDMVKCLLAMGSNVNARYPDGENALHENLHRMHEARRPQDAETFMSLVRSNIDKDAVDKRSHTPLHLAVIHEELEAISVLIDHGANIDQPLSITKHTPLFHAVECGNFKGASLLLEKGANAKATNADGQTALNFAVRRDDLKMVQLLLKHGVDSGAIDHDGATILQFARDDSVIQALGKYYSSRSAA